jgi:hypothetical protein
MDNEITPLYARITKADDATRVVEGLMSGPEQDLDQQVVDQTWLKEAVPAWMRYGNIRQQHDPKMPIGKAISVDFTADGPVLRAKVVDDSAWRLVKEGVLSGFSIGVKNARVVRDGIAKNGRIVGGDLVETSLVDHPSYPKASVKIATKMAGNRWLDEQSGISFEYKDAFPDMDPNEQTAGTQPSADVDSTTEKGAGNEPEHYTMAYDHYHGAVKHDHPHQGEDHTHCKKCGSDDRVCGHRMKSADAGLSTETPVPDENDPTKTTTPDAEKGSSAVISNDVKLTPDTTSASTMALGPSEVTNLLHDIKSMMESLKTTTPSFVEGKGEGAADGFTELHTTDPGTFDESKTLYDAKHKSIIAEIVKEILPSLVADALQKSFATDGDGALLTKGVAPDTIKQYVGDVAKSAADAAVEPLADRLKTVEALAAPVHGIANTRSVEKTFGPDGGDKPAPTLESLARLIEHLPEADRMKAATIAIGEAQQQPMNLSGGFFR